MGELLVLPAPKSFYDYFEKASANLLMALNVAKAIGRYRSLDEYLGKSQRSNIW